jgi:hypothetical protein
VRDRKKDGLPALAVWVGVLGSVLCAGLVLLIAVALVPHALAWGKLWLALGAIVWWPIWYGWIHHRYGTERVNRWEKRQETAKAKSYRWLFAYFMPVFALFVVVLGVVDVGPEWRAAHGGGVPGSFTVTHSDCAKGCMTYGDFTAADGDTRIDVLLNEGGDGPRREAGTVVAAHDTGDRLGVFPDGGAQQWGFSVGFLGLGAAYLVCWSVWLARRGAVHPDAVRVDGPITRL